MVGFPDVHCRLSVSLCVVSISRVCSGAYNIWNGGRVHIKEMFMTDQVGAIHMYLPIGLPHDWNPRYQEDLFRTSELSIAQIHLVLVSLTNGTKGIRLSG